MRRRMTFVGMFTGMLPGSWPVLAFLLGANAMGQQGFLPGDLARQDFWDTDGSINAIVVTNGMAYVGGKFSYVAPNARKVAAIDIYSGASDPEYPAIFGSGISAIIEDGYGGWF